jgi:hypothetical protein
MTETLHIGDLVEITSHPLTLAGPCACGCGLKLGYQGVVISEVFINGLGYPAHNISFAGRGARHPHGIWTQLLKKIQPPPEEELDLIEETLCE